MFEMQSDLVRKHKLNDASKDAKKTGRIPHHSIVERAAMIRDRSLEPKKRRRIPWFTIITIATAIPFFIGGGDKTMNFDISKQVDIQKTLNTMGVDDDNPIKVSVEMGDKEYSKKITASEIEAANSYLQD